MKVHIFKGSSDYIYIYVCYINSAQIKVLVYYFLRQQIYFFLRLIKIITPNNVNIGIINFNFLCESKNALLYRQKIFYCSENHNLSFPCQ